MAVITVRNVPDEVYRALRVRAALNGRSAEAEVRAILADTLLPESAQQRAWPLVARGPFRAMDSLQ